MDVNAHAIISVAVVPCVLWISAPRFTRMDRGPGIDYSHVLDSARVWTTPSVP